MNQTLLLSALLMGLAGTPHCLAMCGAACTAVSGGGRALWSFHLGRLLSYSAAGAVVATGMASLAALGQAVAALRPLWTLVHIAALALGMFLLWQGRQPGWMASLGQTRSAATANPAPGQWQVMRGPLRSAGAGLAWAAWPCGLLQSALLVAALADSPWQGAAVMAGFATASAAGLVLGPGLWRRFGSRGTSTVAAGALTVAVVRFAGLALACGSVWALGHDLWPQLWPSLAAWCGLG